MWPIPRPPFTDEKSKAQRWDVWDHTMDWFALGPKVDIGLLTPASRKDK